MQHSLCDNFKHESKLMAFLLVELRLVVCDFQLFLLGGEKASAYIYLQSWERKENFILFIHEVLQGKQK